MKKVKFLKQTAAALMIATVALTGCKKDKDPVKVSGISLNKTTLTLDIGGSETLTATVTPTDTENKAISWSSSDDAVTTVDADGNVTAVKEGKAIITVTTAGGSQTATCTVTVQAAITGVKLNKTTLEQYAFALTH